jgi:mRNA-degrading endonuclease RelE of RelBE toxin-antitoxin system
MAAGARHCTPFKKKLEERLANPRVPSAALHRMPDCYKIKLRTSGYRLVYRVEDDVGRSRYAEEAASLLAA